MKHAVVATLGNQPDRQTGYHRAGRFLVGDVSEREVCRFAGLEASGDPAVEAVRAEAQREPHPVARAGCPDRQAVSLGLAAIPDEKRRRWKRDCRRDPICDAPPIHGQAWVARSLVSRAA